MRHRIAIVPLGPHEFAAFVDHDSTTSYHRLVLGPDFLREAGLAAADDELVAFEAVAHLLRISPDGQLPEVLRLTTSHLRDPMLVPELRARLGATAE